MNPLRKRIHNLWDHLRKEHGTPVRTGWAVAIGLIIGVSPLYGFHILLCIFFAHVLKLNKITMILTAHISNPIFAPVLVALGIGIGEFVRFGTIRPLDFSAARGFLASLSVIGGDFPDRFVSCLLGDALLGLALAAVFGPMARQFKRRINAAREAKAASEPSLPDPETDAQ